MSNFCGHGLVEWIIDKFELAWSVFLRRARDCGCKPSTAYTPLSCTNRTVLNSYNPKWQSLLAYDLLAFPPNLNLVLEVTISP